MIRRTLFGIAALIVCVTIAPAAHASSASVPYVALGDSFSSGEGNGPFDGPCHRAQHDDSAYPQILPSLVGYLDPPSFHACTGATIDDVVLHPQPDRDGQRTQLEYVDASTKLVTLTIGGNDLGFAEIVKLCRLPGDCSKWKLASKVSERLRSIKARLIAAYTSIRDRMDPGGELVVAGYPHLFISGPGADCKRFFSSGEAAWINSLVNKGNTRIAEAVTAAQKQSGNVSYVDVTERFAGHELCADESWLHGIQIIFGHGFIKGSYHPKREGQEAYALGFATLLRGSAMQAALTG